MRLAQFGQEIFSSVAEEGASYFIVRQTKSAPMKFRFATLDDCQLLAQMNHQLIQDEGHRNPMTVPELEQRMGGWLAGEYRAVIYEHKGEVVAYALFRE